MEGPAVKTRRNETIPEGWTGEATNERVPARDPRLSEMPLLVCGRGDAVNVDRLVVVDRKKEIPTARKPVREREKRGRV